MRMGTVHKLSDSSSGPVETGFRYDTRWFWCVLAAALDKMVAKMVLPTLVLAP